MAKLHFVPIVEQVPARGILMYFITFLFPKIENAIFVYTQTGSLFRENFGIL